MIRGSVRLFRLIGSIGKRLFASAFVGAFVTVGLVFFGNVPSARWSRVPAELARERLEAEQRVAEELGFELDRVVPLTTHVTDVPIELHAGECVALVAATWGPYRVRHVLVEGTRREDVRLYDEDVLGAQFWAGGVVAHTQLCAREDAQGAASVWSERVDWTDERPFERGELRIFRAPEARIGSPERLNRGWAPRAAPDAGGADAGAAPDAGS